MARCPTCHRRLPAAARCPRDGSVAPGATDEAITGEAPVLAGFRVIGLLGSGGFGSVWEAAMDGAAATVALKVSHVADAQVSVRIGREADALRRIGPPHVPALMGSGVLEDGRAYVAMERLAGRTLDQEMAAWPDVPPAAVVRTLGEALLASAAALAARGLCHRDLKPENVFLVGTDPVVAKLMDFGLAVPVSGAGKSQTGTDSGAGTPEYMSPEQIAGQEGDLRTDVYTLGIMLFELVTLRLPFVGERRELEYAHLSFRPPRPSRFASLPGALEQVILRCLAKEPAQRFTDTAALQAAFLAALPAVSEPALGQIEADAAPGDTKAAPKSANAAALRRSERQKVALIFVQAEGVSAIDVQGAVQPFGGQLAHLAPGQCVCAFTHRTGDQPGTRALAAAEALLAKGLARRLIVDVGTVAVKARPDGPARLLSPIFTQANRYPSASDRQGLLITAAARAMLPGVACDPAPGRPDHFILAVADADDGTRTVIHEAPGPLFGRDEPLRALLAEANRAVTERRPRVASVLADRGLGKSRLASELIHQLRKRCPQAEVIELIAREPGGTDADEALAELLRRALDLPAAAPPDGGREILGKRLGGSAKEIAAAAALLLGWIPADDPAVQALRAAPGVLRANVARAGMEAIHRVASRAPLLVVLDDAHWADDALLDALEQATVSELPLWVCALGRPAFAESRPNWGRRATHVERLRLEPLDRDSAGALCRHLLEPATNVPELVVNRLVDRAQAVPMLVTDLVRGLRREGLVRKEAGGVWCVATEVLDRMSDSPLVEWLAGRELDELPAELAAHARLLSLLSTELTSDEVEGVLRVMDAELADAFPLDAKIGIERLRQTRLLVRHRTGRFGFRTEVMREAVGRSVTEALAARIHQAALAYYREAPLVDLVRLPRLAWHAAQAGLRAEAASTYLTLAESARERHNYLEADLLYTRALAQIDEADERLRLRALQGRGIMRYRLGRHGGSLADLAQARELAVRGGDALSQLDVLLDESMALDWSLEWRRSRELAEQARDLAASTPEVPPMLQSRILLALGRSFHRFNQDQEAAELLRDAVFIADFAGDESYEVQVSASLMLGFLLPFLGLLDEAEQRLRRAHELCEAKGDEFHLTAAYNNRSCLWIARNERDRFMEDNGRVLAYSRRIGNAHSERNANLNGAYFLYWRAEFDAALPFARRIIEIEEHYFMQGGFRPEAAVLLARILWGRGDHAEARQLVEDVHRSQKIARAEGKTELMLLPNDEMLLDLTTLLMSGGGPAEWDALMSRAGEVAQGQELIEALELAGTAALRRDDLANARRWWKEALDAGERIPNVMGARIKERLTALG